jgi:hypothetical protein
LIDNNLITSHQSGFTPGDSAVNQLLYITNEFGRALDEGKGVRVDFCDISKAFDRVWHKGLLHSDGKVESVNDKLNSLHKGYLSIDAAFLRSLRFNRSGPIALDVSSIFNINQLLYITSEFGRALDEGKEVRVAFCDIQVHVSKAFDRVWHKGLLTMHVISLGHH